MSYLIKYVFQRKQKIVLLTTITDDSTITCNEVIDREAKSYVEETKTVLTNFNEQKYNL